MKIKNQISKKLQLSLARCTKSISNLKAAVNTRADQTLREVQDEWNGAKRLDRGGFSTAFRMTRASWIIALVLLQITSANLSAAEKPACCAKELPASETLSDKSLYQLESAWTTDASKRIQLTSLHGRPQIVTMFFASCNYACPILVHDMKRIEAALPKNLRDKIGFVLVSFDSQRDTPEALATYRKVHGLPANWTLLHGKPDDVLELGALLGIKFKKEPTGQFAHSNVITLLNSEGEIVSQQLGLNREPASLVADVEKLFQASTD